MNTLRKRWLALIATALMFATIVVVGNIHNAQSRTWLIGKVRSVAFLATVNQSLLTSTSQDTGYVLGTGTDTTAWLPTFEAAYDPAGTGNFQGMMMPDSIFVSFKALDWAATSADSAHFSISVQVRDPANPTILSDTTNLTTIQKTLESADSKVLGFTWKPSYTFNKATTGPLSYQYRYIFHGTGAGGTTHDGDTTRICTMREFRFGMDQ